MRTKEEVSEFVEKHLNEMLFLEFQGKLLLPFCTFETLRKLIKKEVLDDKVREMMEELVEEKIIEEIRNYLPFAFEKAENQRGISANRSIEHFLAWTWLIDKEFHDKIFFEYETNYYNYGMSILKMIKEKYDEKK